MLHKHVASAGTPALACIGRCKAAGELQYALTAFVFVLQEGEGGGCCVGCVCSHLLGCSVYD